MCEPEITAAGSVLVLAVSCISVLVMESEALTQPIDWVIAGNVAILYMGFVPVN